MAGLHAEQWTPAGGGAQTGRFNTRPGFALPLALLTLTVLIIVAGLLLDAGVHEERLAGDEALAVGAEQRVERALVDLLSSAIDSTWVGAPRGSVRRIEAIIAGDSVVTTLQALGSGVLRGSLAARVTVGGRRADARILAFLRVVPAAGGAAGALRLERLAGRWWSQDP